MRIARVTLNCCLLNSMMTLSRTVRHLKEYQVNYFKQSTIPWIIMIFAFLIFGCEDKQNLMMNPIVDDVMKGEPIPEEPSAEEEILTVDFDPEIQERTVPEDIELLETDKVFHTSELGEGAVLYLNVAGEIDRENGERHELEPFVFQDAEVALEDEGIKMVLDSISLYVKQGCETGFWTTGTSITAYFPYPHREERDRFVRSFNPEQWSTISNVVILNNEEVYFHAHIKVRGRAFCE